MTTSILEDYKSHVTERSGKGIPPLPLSYQQTSAICDALREGTIKDKGLDLRELLSERIDPGVTDAGKLKAELLGDVANGNINISGLSKGRAIELLGSMQGGYNVGQLIPLLGLGGDESEAAVSALSNTLLISEPDFKQVNLMRTNGSAAAGQVVTNWLFTGLREKSILMIFLPPGMPKPEMISHFTL
jgi:aconitate hydratase 2/2-methylisocitrate dehydratase